MSEYGFVTPQMQRNTRALDLVVTALTAGVYLFISTMKMIPAGLVIHPARGETIAEEGEKRVKFALFLGGLLFAVIPKLLLS